MFEKIKNNVPTHNALSLIGVLIIFLSFMLFPFKQGLLNGSTTLIGLIGLFFLIFNFKSAWLIFKKSQILFFMGLFYLPLLISLPDSFNLTESLKTFLAFSRYIFAASFILYLCQSSNNMIILARALTCLMLFWCIDAIIQLRFGSNLFGMKYDGYRVTGIFTPKYHLGYILALLSPIFLETLRRDFLNHKIKRFLIIPLLGILVATIIISNTRAAWLSFAISFLLWGFWNIFHKNISIKIVVSFILGMILAGGIALQAPSVQTRMQQSVKVFAGDSQSIDQASSSRVSLWKTALSIYKSHPINGVGLGASYDAYAQKSYVERGNQDFAYFPHLFILEVMLETGTIGLLSYIVFYLGIFWVMIQQKIQAEWMIVSCVALMPFNTHVALYGSYASSLIWFPLLIGLGLRFYHKKY